MGTMGEGEGEMHRQNSIEINTCAKLIANEKLLHSTESSAWCFVMT